MVPAVPENSIATRPCDTLASLRPLPQRIRRYGSAAELVGRQPAVTIGGRFVMLPFEQFRKRGVLFRRALRHREQTLHAKIARSRAAIELLRPKG